MGSALPRSSRSSYDEYNALKAWLIGVGEDGEWPLFLDVFVEHVVEEVNTAHRRGSNGSIEGPYCVASSPEIFSPAALPMRDGEQGTPLLWTGRIITPDGSPLAGKIEL